MANLFVTRSIAGPAIDRLIQAGHRLDVYPEDQAIPRDALLQSIRGRDGLLCLLTDTIDREIIDAGDRLRIIANHAVGYNNIDVAYAASKGIVVTNTPGVLTETSADMTWALIFAVMRRVTESERFLREGRFTGWGPMMFLGRDITGSTLGIVGAGRIGVAVARRSAGFQMPLLYTSRNASEAMDMELGAQRVPLERLLAESDIISLHVPLTEETRHLIGERELKLMRPSACLINTSRGPVVDEKALVRALKEGWIAGAGLDVYEREPHIEPGLLDSENAVLCPHIASATIGTRTKMALMAAENLIAFFGGLRPPNAVSA